LRVYPGRPADRTADCRAALGGKHCPASGARLRAGHGLASASPASLAGSGKGWLQSTKPVFAWLKFRVLCFADPDHIEVKLALLHDVRGVERVEVINDF